MNAFSQFKCASAVNNFFTERSLVNNEDDDEVMKL